MKRDSIDMDALEAMTGVYGVDLIMNNPELMLIAYRSAGYDNARLSKNGTKVIPGKKIGKEEWTAEKISIEVQKSQWAKDRTSNQEEAEIYRSSNPENWSWVVEEAKNNFMKDATDAGVTVSPEDADRFVETTLLNYWGRIDKNNPRIPTDLSDSFFASRITASPDGKYKGEAAVTASDLREKARKYGVKFSDSWYLNNIQGLKGGTLTEADVDQQIVDAAKSRYVTLADKISPNLSTWNLADGYMETMASVWGVDRDSIDLSTPEIQQALLHKDPATGQTSMQNLYEFELDLRKSPNWDNSKNGHKALNDAGMQWLKDLGFWE